MLFTVMIFTLKAYQRILCHNDSNARVEQPFKFMGTTYLLIFKAVEWYEGEGCGERCRGCSSGVVSAARRGPRAGEVECALNIMSVSTFSTSRNALYRNSCMSR